MEFRNTKRSIVAARDDETPDFVFDIPSIDEIVRSVMSRNHHKRKIEYQSDDIEELPDIEPQPMKNSPKRKYEFSLDDSAQELPDLEPQRLKNSSKGIFELSLNDSAQERRDIDPQLLKNSIKRKSELSLNDSAQELSDIEPQRLKNSSKRESDLSLNDSAQELPDLEPQLPKNSSKRKFEFPYDISEEFPDQETPPPSLQSPQTQQQTPKAAVNFCEVSQALEVAAASTGRRSYEAEET